MNGLSPRLSRALALLLALLVIAVFYALLIQPVLAARAASAADLATLQHRLAKYRSIGAGRTALEQQLQQVQQRSRADRAFLNASSEALAVATLQQLVKQHVGRSGGQLSRLQVNPSRDEEGFRRVSINVKLRIEEKGLAQLLYSLGQGAPVLFVDQLRIRALQLGSSSRGKGRHELDVSFDLAGYQRAEAA